MLLKNAASCDKKHRWTCDGAETTQQKKKEKSRDPSAFSHAHLVQNTIIHEHGSKNQPPNKPSFIKFFLGGCNLGIHQN